MVGLGVDDIETSVVSREESESESEQRQGVNVLVQLPLFMTSVEDDREDEEHEENPDDEEGPEDSLSPGELRQQQQYEEGRHDTVQHNKRYRDLSCTRGR